MARSGSDMKSALNALLFGASFFLPPPRRSSTMVLDRLRAFLRRYPRLKRCVYPHSIAQPAKVQREKC